MGILAFSSPLLLLALILLPAIYWLLRISPPRPEREIFPPFRILLALGKREETPATTPPWLLILRLMLAAVVIVALAGPMLNPNSIAPPANGPLAIVFDNGWATAPTFDKRRLTAELLIRKAGELDLPVSLVFTASRSPDATPMSATDALAKLAAARPEPLTGDRLPAIEAISKAFGTNHPGTLVLLSDGISGKNDTAAFKAIAAIGADDVRLIGENNGDAIALTNAQNAAERMTVTAERLATGRQQTFTVAARDIKGRVLGTAELAFGPADRQATAAIEAPYEMRNDFQRLTLDATETAGAVRLLDDSFKRRSVGLISGEAGDRSQPLLSPLYYISRALSPFANIFNASSQDLSVAIPEMTAAKPSVIVLADIGRLPAAAETALSAWIESGGTLVRFAGPRLAAAPADDPLIPVRLRIGERALGGAMSWSAPQPLDNFAATSPFAGLSNPTGVLVNRQVLAEPSSDLQDMTWASLKDGTPLVTSAKMSAGRIILFHVTADTSWSNLPLSGEFVEMLRRIVQMSHSSASPKVVEGKSVLAPFRLLDAKGTLTATIGEARPIETGGKAVASLQTPPGLYGSEEGFEALNLFTPDSTLTPISIPATLSVIRSGFAGDDTISIKPWLLLAAMLMAIADTIAMLLLAGAFARRIAPGVAIVCLAVGALFSPHPAHADDSKPGDDKLMARLDRTHLAYVITGESDVDHISERGLAGLSDYLYYRTALEPGDPVGVDIAKDELSIFSILYWPVSATAPMPTPAAISRIDAYMRSGGTVLFDTRDQLSTLTAMGGVSPNTQRLRDILADIDIPPLEPVPSDHVLTKSFYLLKSWPGRFAGSPLWVEAQATGKPDPARPARAGDGVSPILITGNDFAGAWAVDEMGNPLLPMVPPDENQREMAFRTGVNIMMYMLTGNYKSDQVHIPALLERLGQ